MIFFFYFGEDSNIKKLILDSKTKIDSAYIISSLFGANKKEINDELQSASLYKPAIRMRINDSIIIPLYNDTISYVSTPFTFRIESKVLQIKSKTYNIDTSYHMFDVFFNIKTEFINYFSIVNDTMTWNNNHIFIKHQGRKINYNILPLSEAQKYIDK